MQKTTRELMNENTIREKEIAPENKEVYTNMIAYIRGAKLSERNVEAIRSDITEMLIDAQMRVENIQHVFGENYKEICDEIIEAMPKKTMKDSLLEFIDIILKSTWRLGLITLVTNAISDFGTNRNLTHYTLTLGEIISMVIIIIAAYGIVYYVTKTALNNQDSKKTSALEMIGVFVLFMLILLPTFLLRSVIIETSYLTAVLIIGLLFMGSKLVEKHV